MKWIRYNEESKLRKQYNGVRKSQILWTKAWFPLRVHMLIVLTTKFEDKFRGEIKKVCNKESSSPIISLDIVYNSFLLLAWRVALLAASYTIFHTALKYVFPHWLLERKCVCLLFHIFHTSTTPVSAFSSPCSNIMCSSERVVLLLVGGYVIQPSCWYSTVATAF
jgi:hypothetical protein